MGIAQGSEPGYSGRLFWNDADVLAADFSLAEHQGLHDGGRAAPRSARTMIEL